MFWKRIVIVVLSCAVVAGGLTAGYFAGRQKGYENAVQQLVPKEQQGMVPVEDPTQDPMKPPVQSPVQKPADAKDTSEEKEYQEEYLIETVEDLKALAEKVNGGWSGEGCRFVLVNDLDLGGEEWTPIGTYTKGFNGCFDGGGHTVKGLSITQAPLDFSGGNKWHNSIECVGLFGLAHNASRIENLRVEGQIHIDKQDAPVRDDVIAGGVVGMTRGVLYNCHNACDVTVILPGAESYANVGGVCGTYTWESALVDGCSNTGKLHAEAPVARVGGVCGDNDGHGAVRNCVNFGDIVAGAPEEYRLAVNAGGMVAHTANSTVTNCANYGAIRADGEAGGLVGQLYGTDDFGGDTGIFNCFSAGRVESFGTTQGNICGQAMYGTIHQCYYSESGAAVGKLNGAQAGDLWNGAQATGEQLLSALNGWVDENGAGLYNVWRLDSQGRAVPLK